MTRLSPEKESLTIEFKSDRKRLPDHELVAAAMCLANTEGGEIYLGVEKDGSLTGLHQEHRNLTGLAAMIANRTNPPLSVVENERNERARLFEQMLIRGRLNQVIYMKVSYQFSRSNRFLRRV